MSPAAGSEDLDSDVFGVSPPSWVAPFLLSFWSESVEGGSGGFRSSKCVGVAKTFSAKCGIERDLRVKKEMGDFLGRRTVELVLLGSLMVRVMTMVSLTN